MRTVEGEREHFVIAMVTSQHVSLTTYTQTGWTPLMIAAFCGECEVVMELLDSGADVNGQSNVSHINMT